MEFLLLLFVTANPRLQVPFQFFFLMQCSRIQGTEREYKCRLMQCITSFMHLSIFNLVVSAFYSTSSLVVEGPRYSLAKRGKID